MIKGITTNQLREGACEDESGRLCQGEMILNGVPEKVKCCHQVMGLALTMVPVLSSHGRIQAG